MESKRKASGANGPEPTADTDRAAKRRKLIEEYGDLADGETHESTTAYGLSILESIRATTDKNGRAVSPYFETLPSRSKNAQYYKKIRLPLSLEVIERKLKERQYATLSSLESDFKRLVSNAKETNDRSSTIFGDAERVRKAVSNLMVKYNPAYKSGNYQAVPTPLPPTPEPEEEEEEEEEEGEDEEAEDEADEDTGVRAKGEDELEPGTQDGVDDAEAEGVEEDEEEEVDEDQDEEEAEDEDDDEDSQPKRRRGSSWRKAGSRARDSTTPAQRSTPRTSKAYHTYEGVPFKGLSFQQAQEKIVDDLIRKKEDADDYPYFEPFIYKPPRTLKDYYDVIAEPLSLKALQKQVRGQRGRLEATYVSDFKGWAAFEDQASLIWKNAYHYNEDGSDIFILAQELEESFQELLKEAKAIVPEPPQPKIKLRLPQAAESSGHPKKITIHVGGKNSVTGSPAPVTGQSGDSEGIQNETPVNRNPFNGGSSAGTSVIPPQLDKARSMSASAGPPSPSVKAATKTEDAIQMVPAVQPQAPPTTFQHFVPVTTMAPVPMMNGTPLQYQQPLPPPPPKRSASDILEAQKYRPQPITEAEALMPRLVIATHPSLPVESKLVTTFVASPTEYQQEIVVNAPMSHYRVQLKPQVASFLETGQREWKLNVIHDATPLYPTLVPFDKRGESIFEVTLRYGVNRIEVRLIAALPRDETAPNGLNMEMERFVIHYNLLRH